ncbi:MAG: cytochrome b/b6 domain-containing protein [Roseovarius sp.]|nr:cytochrome b/b6 domain-containing protein [Roseovarius sp.]
MPIGNTKTAYGPISRTLHWTTFLLIATVFPLGKIASEAGHSIETAGANASEADISQAALLFSAHKTLGIIVFFVALTRITWAASQPKPGLLNGDKFPEAILAETVHWLLYGSLVLVPLSGWVHHAATSGYAPIFWPFGQNLPFVPKNETLAELSGTMHGIFASVLIGSIAVHVAGALKHHFLDRDTTLRRMLSGSNSEVPTGRQPGLVAPLALALAIWMAAIGISYLAGVFSAARPDGNHVYLNETNPADNASGNWDVQEGEIKFAVKQLGADVEGSFEDWNAIIHYSDIPDKSGRHGSVRVDVAIESLKMGSIAAHALDYRYLNVFEYPMGIFEAEIFKSGDSLTASGFLILKDMSVPVAIPINLDVDGDNASASGLLQVDRRNFGIGDEGEDNVGSIVTISFNLTAKRAE